VARRDDTTGDYGEVVENKYEFSNLDKESHHHLLGGTEENHKDPQSRCSVSFRMRSLYGFDSPNLIGNYKKCLNNFITQHT
jgi:hypothetical protein